MIYKQIAKAHFSYTIWLMISEKSIMAYTFLHYGGERTQKSQQTRHTKKIFTRISNSFSPSLSFMCTCDFYRYEHIYLQKKGISKHSGKKIMWLVWTVVTCLMLNMELSMILIELMEFACIRHSWTLQEMNLTVC